MNSSLPNTVKNWFRSFVHEQQDIEEEQTQEIVDERAVEAPEPEWIPPEPLRHDRGKRISELCKAQDWYTDWYKRWVAELKEPTRFHRKQWEFVYVMQSLWERSCIAYGKKGLVFAVGTEPLPSVFANYGCDILATDIFPEVGAEKGWTVADQLCYGIESLNKKGLCDDATLRRHVQYRAVDMNDIPDDLRDFDFNWSSCSFEHLGSIEKGLSFLKNQLKTLKPGGWAVHTTEYNVSSEELTLDNDNTVIFRRKDLEKLADELRREGHYVEPFDFSMGAFPEDYAVDYLPHKQEVHLKLQINEFIVTSVGLIIRKAEG
jgi:SAM-dependent methyltransferase